MGWNKNPVAAPKHKPEMSSVSEQTEPGRRFSGGQKIFRAIAKELGLDIRTITDIDLHIPAVPIDVPLIATVRFVVNRDLEDAMIDEANANNAEFKANGGRSMKAVVMDTAVPFIQDDDPVRHRF